MLTPNLLRAINAVRCMISNLGTNVWTLLASAYWAMKTFKLESLMVKYLNIAYDNLCTCKDDVDMFIKLLQSTPKDKKKQAA